MIFVFGSNLAGRHGKGAALHARNYEGAIYGQGSGRQGNSYAIPTKNEKLRTLTLGSIAQWVEEFIEYAKDHPNELFKVTRVGCGLAGFKDEDIYPLFRDAPLNCYFPKEWKKLNDSKTCHRRYWH